MTAPTEHPTPGSVLTEADVAKLRPGDVLKVVVADGFLKARGYYNGMCLTFRACDEGYLAFDQIAGEPSCLPFRFTFVSRPQPVSGSEGEGVEAAVERMAGWIGYTENGGCADWSLYDPTADLRTLLASHDAQRAEIKALKEIELLANELVNGGGLVNRGVDRGLVVVEKADNSDPHYRLCKALERRARTLTQGGTGQ